MLSQEVCISCSSCLDEIYAEYKLELLTDRQTFPALNLLFHQQVCQMAASELQRPTIRSVQEFFGATFTRYAC